MIRAVVSPFFSPTSRIIQRPTTVRAILGVQSSRKLTPTYCTMAEGSGNEGAGFTRRRMDAMLQKTGYTPKFISPNAMRIDLPSLSHCAFDTQGQRQIVCYLMKLFDMTIWYWPLPTKHLDEQLVLYSLNYEMNLHTSLYDDSKKWPVVIENKINYVKRSSRCYQVDMRQADKTVPMASSRYVDINVDPETKRPRPFPQWWKDDNQFPEDGPKPEVGELVRPETGILTTERRIHFTDTDENNHTNFVVYVRLCLDTFYENVLNGKYPNSSRAFLKGWLRSVKVTFKSETMLGDTLAIDSWEDGQFSNTFHFEMRKGQDVAATVSLSLYSSLADSHL